MAQRSLSRAVSAAVVLAALALFVYPAVVVSLVAVDPTLRATGQSRFVPYWFKGVAGRYAAWSGRYLEAGRARGLHHENVAATEWPMFGSVFFLLTAEELQRQGKLDVAEVRAAVDRAAAVVASPDTATWVRAKWGEGYLERENVFYRMLLLMGLTSHERLTGDRRHHETISRQRSLLAAELQAAPLHLADDYPDECYPSDVLWAVAAVRRAAALEGVSGDTLAGDLMAVLDTPPVRGEDGLPAYQVTARTGKVRQKARGNGNSGILTFAAELDPAVAARWYQSYEQHYWQAGGWVAGFREHPRGDEDPYADVDSGPVIRGLGSVASVFGIGAARSVGRFDHAVPLAMESVAAVWPTPFGFLLPGAAGWLAADGWCLGEIALLFSMTRPVAASATVPFAGPAPGIVWVLAACYLLLGVLLIWIEVRHGRQSMLNGARRGSPGRPEQGGE